MALLFFVLKEAMPQASPKILPLPDSAAVHLGQAISYPTIAYMNRLQDSSAFKEFGSFLIRAYPLIHQYCERTVISQYSYIYKWQGKNSNLEPYIFMAHQDVVPVEDSDSAWTKLAFSGKLVNDTIWGRGTVDDKGSLISIMEAAEQLLAQKFTPERTIYFCFGHDEEAGGMNGARLIVEWFKSNNIRAELVLDEGLEIIEKNYAPLKVPVALIGVGEKGYASFELSVNKPGGHSSTPEKETAIDILNKALIRLYKNPMKARLVPTLKDFFKRVKPYLPPGMRFAVSNLWFLKRQFISKMEGNKGTNAAIRTTIVTTIMNSGVKDNVIPAVARATVNSRILPGETVADVEAHIRKSLRDDRVRIKPYPNNWDPSQPLTSTKHTSFLKVEALIKELVPTAVTAPMIVIGATDSRFYRSISNGVINFLPVIDSQGFHGLYEHRAVKDLQRMITFYSLLIQKSGESLNTAH